MFLSFICIYYLLIKTDRILPILEKFLNILLPTNMNSFEGICKRKYDGKYKFGKLLNLKK
jgi:hypothetical protein